MWGWGGLSCQGLTLVWYGALPSPGSQRTCVPRFVPLDWQPHLAFSFKSNFRQDSGHATEFAYSSRALSHSFTILLRQTLKFLVYSGFESRGIVHQVGKIPRKSELAYADSRKTESLN